MFKERKKYWPFDLGKYLFVSVPEIEILDERDTKVGEKFYKGGSTIELKCLVRNIVGEPPEYILWHHDDRMLNYDTERGGIRYEFATTVKDVYNVYPCNLFIFSVKTDLLKDGAVSRLYIAFASKRDDGNYTCSMRSAQTSVLVHILNGGN